MRASFGDEDSPAAKAGLKAGQLITSIKSVIGNIGRHTAAPVMLAPMDIRRFMRKIVEREFPDLAVLSYQELSAHVNVQPLDRIKLAMQIAAE